MSELGHERIDETIADPYSTNAPDASASGGASSSEMKLSTTVDRRGKAKRPRGGKARKRGGRLDSSLVKSVRGVSVSTFENEALMTHVRIEMDTLIFYKLY